LKLAASVKTILAAKRPDNPDRALTFPRWELHGTRLIRLGWAFMLTRVSALRGNGNWLAAVKVLPIARTEDRRSVAVFNHHVEYYRYLDGKLELTGQDIDPTHDPTAGLEGLIGH
jgi:hypothetical protein